MAAVLYEANMISHWDVIDANCMKDWTRRGELFHSLTETQSKALIRCSPEDGLCGFFVAVFRKRGNSDCRSTLTMIKSDEIEGICNHNCNIKDEEEKEEDECDYIACKDIHESSDHNCINRKRKRRQMNILMKRSLRDNEMWKPMSKKRLV